MLEIYSGDEVELIILGAVDDVLGPLNAESFSCSHISSSKLTAPGGQLPPFEWTGEPGISNCRHVYQLANIMVEFQIIYWFYELEYSISITCDGRVDISVNNV